jgi:hypothetical protein
VIDVPSWWFEESSPGMGATHERDYDKHRLLLRARLLAILLSDRKKRGLKHIFYTLREAQIVMVFVPAFAAWPAALPRPAPPATLAKRPTSN